MEVLVSLVALVVALVALVIAHRDHRLARTKGGGHGLSVTLNIGTSYVTPNASGQPVERKSATLRLRADGPGVWHDLSVYIGTLQTPVFKAVRYDCHSAPWQWEVRLVKSDYENAWYMVTWLAPHLEGLRSEAMRSRIDGTMQAENWYWHNFYRLRLWYNAQKFVPRRCKPLPLGGWRTVKETRVPSHQGPKIPEYHITPHGPL
ncbi:hypothetical protein [Hoyosella altamirensis]|uniref:Uncharacterized protein n=1 Tax=Hoyosella altamirensis TaxID=616997 RepID=A0A839RQA1_9ACTN|nr:hypothetical protein [Hoyosella altamirensis]MBB3038975.1 hypothetical protein [Hoyosella altamirensis]